MTNQDTFGKVLGIRKGHWAELVNDLCELERVREVELLPTSLRVAIDSVLSAQIECGLVH